MTRGIECENVQSLGMCNMSDCHYQQERRETKLFFFRILASSQLFLKTREIIWGSRDGLAVKPVHCSCRGSQVGSHSLTHTL